MAPPSKKALWLGIGTVVVRGGQATQVRHADQFADTPGDRSHGQKVDSAFLDYDWTLNHVPR